YGRRGDQAAERTPAPIRRPAAATRKAKVISDFPGLRPSRDPRLEYAARSDFALRASKNWPPVWFAIARSVAGSGGTGTLRLKPNPPGKPWGACAPPPNCNVPFGVPSATVYTGMPAAFARSAPWRGSKSPRVCAPSERKRMETRPRVDFEAAVVTEARVPLPAPTASPPSR